MITAHGSGNFIDPTKLSWKPNTDYSLFIDTSILGVPPPNSIFIQVEPNTVYANHWKIDSRNAIRTVHTQYSYILTFDEELLRTLPNAIKYVYGTTWIKPDEYMRIQPSLKQYAISSITGKKQFGTGHTLRTSLYNKQMHFPIPHTAFRSSKGAPPIIRNNPTLGDSKLPLFEKFQFALVIENSRQHNYFTEKLCDCLITKTIPVYYGCPNIDEYFDTRGWVILDSESDEDALIKMKRLTVSHYTNHISIVEANARTVLEYIDIHKNIDKALLTIK
jgi:hypothetical protein